MLFKRFTFLLLTQQIIIPHQPCCIVQANENDPTLPLLLRNSASPSDQQKYHRNQQSLPIAPKPPRADQIMNYGFNVFLGKDAEEQRKELFGEKLFDYTGGDLFDGDKFRPFQEMGDFSSSAYCESESSSNLAVYIIGSLSLSFQRTFYFSTESQFGDEEFIDGVSNILDGILSSVGDTLDRVIEEVNGVISDTIETVFENIDETIGDITSGVGDIVGDAVDAIADSLWDNTFGAVGDFFGGLFGRIFQPFLAQINQYPSTSASVNKEKQNAGLFSGIAGVLNNNVIKALTFEGATVRGNTKGSTDAQANFRLGYSFKYTRYALQTLYSATNDFSKVNRWTSEFTSAARGLGAFPSDGAILEFFATYGTHAIKQAVFGQKCEATISMTGGSSASLYTSAATNGSIEGLVWWDTDISGSFAGDLTGQYQANAFNYRVSNRVCHGKLLSVSSCAGTLQAIGFNEPSMLDYTYIPIHNIETAPLSTGARVRMQIVSNNLKRAAIKCAKEYCNSHGACAPKISAWADTNASKTNLMNFWDGDHCFCEDDFYGEDCSGGYFLNEEAYGATKDEDQRLLNNVLNVCPLSSLLTESECKDSSTVLGIGRYNSTTLEEGDIPVGCFFNPEEGYVFYNEGAYEDSTYESYVSATADEYSDFWKNFEGEVGGFWEFDEGDASQYKPICRKIHQMQEELKNCDTGTEVHVDDCCLAAASLYSDLDQTTGDPTTSGTYVSTGACNQVHVTKNDDGKVTLEYEPYAVSDKTIPKGCVINKAEKTIQFNQFDGNQNNNDITNKNAVAVCLNEIGDLEDDSEFYTQLSDPGPFSSIFCQYFGACSIRANRNK